MNGEKTQIESCLSCRFSHCPLGGYVTCRRNPPMESAKFPGDDARWPFVRVDDWCGEFQPKYPNDSSESLLNRGIPEPVEHTIKRLFIHQGLMNEGDTPTIGMLRRIDWEAIKKRDRFSRSEAMEIAHVCDSASVPRPTINW
jgi:hypothetical protein